MKILSISRLSFIGAMILVLFIAWSATRPQRISGKQLVAGWSNCKMHAVTCSSVPGKRCSESLDYCRLDGSGYCMNAGGTGIAFQCEGLPNCLPRVDLICVGGT